MIPIRGGAGERGIAFIAAVLVVFVLAIVLSAFFSAVSGPRPGYGRARGERPVAARADRAPGAQGPAADTLLAGAARP